AANYYGADSFTFKANDGADSNPATVSIDVAPMPDAPTAIDQAVAATEDMPRTITLAGTDVDGPAPTVFIITDLPLSGALYDGPDASGHPITAEEAAAGYVLA